MKPLAHESWIGRWILWMATAAFLLASVEMVIAGPYGFCLWDIRLRHVLWGAGGILGFLCLARPSPDRDWQVHLISGIVLFAIIWAIVVPWIHGGASAVRQGLLESRPILGIVMLPNAMAAAELLGIRRLVVYLAWLISVPATVLIVAWIQANLFNDTGIAEWLLSLYSHEAPEQRPMIGPIHDGTYRVMWIIVILFPFVILGMARERLFYPLAAIMVTASFCSGTRAVYYCSLMAAVVAIVTTRRHWLGVVVIVGPHLLLLVPQVFPMMDSGTAQPGNDPQIVSNAEELSPTSPRQHTDPGAPQPRNYPRILSLGEDMSPTSPRRQQAAWLLQMFRQFPIFGAGFGAVAGGTRSSVAPFSYELTYLSLLAKTGVVGLVCLLLWFREACHGASRMFLRRSHLAIAVTAAGFFLLITALNPYLLTLFGMWLLIMLIVTHRKVVGSQACLVSAP
jgi:hypothetical protein